jgi:hypothetical protein
MGQLEIGRITMSWDVDFAGLPLELPDGRKLETLADCRAWTCRSASSPAGKASLPNC